MNDLAIWKALEINRLRCDVERLFQRLTQDFGISPFAAGLTEFPPLEIRARGRSLVVLAEVGDVSPESLEISLSSDRLTVCGRTTIRYRRSAPGGRETEVKVLSFSRTMQLPCRVRPEEVRAILRQGWLEIVLPKYEPEKRRSIRIRVL